MSRRPLPALLLVLALTTACGSTVQTTGAGSVLSSGGAAGLSAPTGDGLGGTVVAPDGTVDPRGSVDPGGSGGSAPAGTALPGQPGSAVVPGAAAGPAASGGAAAAPGAVPGGAAPTVGIPATGRGWDAKNVYIGVGTQKDVQQAFSTVGVSNLDAGDQEGQAKAIAAELNRRGGLFGRQVKIVFRDHATIATAQDPNGTAQATCTYFTQDRPVIAYLNPVTLMDVSALRGCFAKAKVPLISASLASLDAEGMRAYAPYLLTTLAPTWDALTPVLVSRLSAQGYFGGWDTATSRTKPGAAKVGILIKSDDIAPRILARIKKAVEAAGAPGVESYTFRSDASDVSSAVLQFRGRGVSHVISTDGGALLAFMLAAEDQGYRPRYAASSFLTPAIFYEGTAPPAQLVGMTGVGWSASIDVSDAKDPGDAGPGESECKALLAEGGQTFKGKRLAEAVAFAFCDGLRLIVSSATAAGGLTGADVARGMQLAAPKLQTSFSFGNGFGPNRFFLPGAVRDLAYDTGCRCFAYVSKTNQRM